MRLPWQDPQRCTSEPRGLFPHVVEFCASLVPESTPLFLEVTPESSDVLNECVSNVRRRVEKFGGQAVAGWQVWEWHGVMIEAEFHMVWRDQDGKLRDVTPKPAGITRILFLANPSIGKFDQQVKNVRRPLIDDDRLRRFIDAAHGIFDIYNRGERAKQFGQISVDRSEYVEPQRLESVKAEMMRAILFSTPGRNDLCRCGTGTKWKKCHGR